MMTKDDLQMPWGAFKGKLICEIPSGYLMWLAANCEDDEIATAADEEYRWRTDSSAHFWD